MVKSRLIQKQKNKKNGQKMQKKWNTVQCLCCLLKLVDMSEVGHGYAKMQNMKSKLYKQGCISNLDSDSSKVPQHYVISLEAKRQTL